MKDAAGHPVVNPAKFKSVARKAIRAIGYEQSGFHWKTAKIDVLLHGQSADIAQGVDETRPTREEGAGDQGIMFGYACRETPDLMPAPIYYSHKILELLAAARHDGDGDVRKLGPDAKSQVTVRYVGGKPVGVTQIVLSTQHLDGSWDSRKVRKVVEPFIREALRTAGSRKDTNWYINPTGKFVIGGPDGDAGLTGRKIIVDTYGGAAPHGGGAFSGKDTTKVDRSAAYAARYLAKNVVAAKLADRAPSSSPTPSASPSRCRSMSTCMAPARSTRPAREGAARGDGPVAVRHPPSSRPQQADLREHLGLWPFRAQARPRRLVSLGKDRPHQGARRTPWPPSRFVMTAERRSRSTEAFFGRRHGKTIRPLQAAALAEVLPKYRIDLGAPPPEPLTGLFRAPVREVRLEIGFGGGEHLLHRASSEPATGFIGVEPFVNGMARLMNASKTRRSTISRSMAMTPPASSTGCRPARSPESTCSIPTRGRRSGTGSGASSARSISTASLACSGLAAGSASPPISTPTSTGRCCTAARIRPSSGWPAPPTTGASLTRIGRARAMRPRRCARAGSRRI